MNDSHGYTRPSRTSTAAAPRRPPHLDGRVAEGMDVMDAIRQGDAMRSVTIEAR